MPWETTDEPVHPRAHSWRVMACGDPNCHPHIVLFDEHNNIICDAVIRDTLIDKLWAELHEASAHIKAMRG